LPKDHASGEVDVVDTSRRFVARGLYDSESPLAVRIWTLDPSERIDAALVARRVALAAAYREAVIDRHQTDSYRLCNGEGDRMPGLVCDVYGHTAVIKIDSRALEPLVAAAAEAVKAAVPQLRRILLRRSVRTGRKRARSGPGTPRRRGESLALTDDTPRDELQPLLGSLPDAPVRMREHGMTFEVDVRYGHKTGAYLDQRDNRQLVRGLARSRRVLDVFSYTGGFAVASALGGAATVRCIDVSRHALDAAKRNFALNNLDRLRPGHSRPAQHGAIRGHA
jgi:23S rRNA (cytosine1962-C5)-methyltransferase